MCFHDFGKGFTNYYNLKRHLVIHNGLKPYACSLCEYSCNKDLNLKRQMQTYSVEREFLCGVCTYSSVTKKDLDRHMTVSTG